MRDLTFSTRCPECLSRFELHLGQTGQVVNCNCGQTFRAVRNHKVTRWPIASACLLIWAVGTVAISVSFWNKNMGAFNQIQGILKDAQNEMQRNLGDALNQ